MALNPAAESAPESEIRSIIEGLAKAVRTRNSKAAASHLAPHVVVFDLINPLQYHGADDVHQRAAQWLASFKEDPQYEIRDLNIVASETVAHCHSLNHVSGVVANGQQIDMWWRATVCFHKQNGQWLVVHEHSSIPMDPNTGKASPDLKPYRAPTKAESSTKK
jgi:ketosteroid isomerase-like protein